MCWSSVVLLPAAEWRWKSMRFFARSLAVLSGTKIRVEGLENLPGVNETCVYVANHASYLDGMVMVAALPKIFRNVAKSELKDSFVSRLFLNNMGVEYVERFDIQRGVEDAQHMLESVKNRHSLFFYPEGTFQRMPGLMNFHMGAFLTAAEANVPVIPVAIRGTRSILPAGSNFPRRGRITINIGKPVNPQHLADVDTADKWQVALRLRDEARKHILHYCGEPDISHSR
jgi:1-acyl-sn-glycerol-3-phosphate acyltransferase